MTRQQHDYCGDGIDEEFEHCALCKRRRRRRVRIIRDVTGRAVLAVRTARRELQIGRFPSDCGPCDGTGTEPWWRLPAWCAVVGFVGGTAAALAASYFTGAAAVAVWAAVLAAAGMAGGLAYRGKP